MSTKDGKISSGVYRLYYLRLVVTLVKKLYLSRISIYLFAILPYSAIPQNSLKLFRLYFCHT